MNLVMEAAGGKPASPIRTMGPILWGAGDHLIDAVSCAVQFRVLTEMESTKGGCAQYVKSRTEVSDG